MKMLRGLLFFCLAVAAFGQCGDVDPLTHLPDAKCLTFGAANGYMWLSLANPARLGLVIGMGEGMNWGMSDDKELKFDDFFPAMLTFGEIQSRVDSFYSDSRNRNIPITWAMYILTLQLKGRDAQALLESDRKNADAQHSKDLLVIPSKQ